MKMKYVVIEGGGAGTPILFPPWVHHRKFARKDNVLGAGFCHVLPCYNGIALNDGLLGPDIEVACFGESVSLGVVSRGGIDADIIREMLLND
jgi:hypothetical protein